MLSTLEIILLGITVLLVFTLGYDYLKSRDWENLSLLSIKTMLFTLIYVVSHYY